MTLFIALLALAQGQTQIMSIPSKTFTHVRTEKSTEGTVRTQVATAFFLSPASPGKRVSATFLCYKQCVGGKHAAHAQCDDSCDTACPFDHSRTVFADADEPDWDDFLGIVPSEERIALLPNGGGYDYYPTELAFFDAVDDIGDALYDYRVKVSTPHFAKSCSSARLDLGYDSYVLNAHLVIRCEITKGGEKQTVDRTMDFTVTTVYIPSSKVIVGQSQIIHCKCEKPQTWSQTPPTEKDDFPQTWTPLQYTWGNPVDVNSPGLKWTASGMSSISGAGTVDNGVRTGFYAPPGSILEDWDGSNDYQRLTLIGPLNQFFEPLSPGFGPYADPVADGSTPTACTELHKRPPDGRRMKLGPVRDPLLQQIAMIGRNDVIRGLYDQVRIWIYTDRATKDEINKVLFPRTTSSGYVRALYDDYRVGALDLGKPEFKRLFGPSLLDCFTAPAAAQKWFVMRLSHLDRKGLVNALESAGAKIAGSIRSDIEVKGFGQIIDALACVPAADVRLGLKKFLADVAGSPRGSEIAAASKWWTAMKSGK